MSTTKRPERNLTAADLGLDTISDGLVHKLVEVIAQRDQLLEASKAALAQLEEAIARATGTLPGRSSKPRSGLVRVEGDSHG